MSELVTLTTGQTETIYGTLAGATSYLALMLGPRYDAWRALSTDDMKRSLATARRWLDRYSYVDAADTFAERDALTDFVNASYELAAALAEDPSIATSAGGGDGVRSVAGGGVSVSFDSAQVTASGLPDIVVKLLGKYLSTTAATATGGYASTGTDENPFAAAADYDRTGPF